MAVQAVSGIIRRQPLARLALTRTFASAPHWDRIDEIRKAHPNNKSMKHFTKDNYDSLSKHDQALLWKCAKTGFENPDSNLGCYAMQPADYDKFAAFFDPVILEYHNGTPTSVHESCWDISAVGDGGVLDVSKLGSQPLSMRVRVGRNLTAFNLPGNMSQKERVEMEKALVPVFEQLMKKYGGSIYSLSPSWGDGPNPNLISDAKYNELVKAHVMFKDMDADAYLKSAGISAHWPYGRGCWQSHDKSFIIWFGEEDHLRIMNMKVGNRLDEIFMNLRDLLDTVESVDGVNFAQSSRYGNVTSCPSNLGTGMRASVHIKCPNLTSDGTDRKAKKICAPFRLQVRGTGGEHTPIGADGTIDVSPLGRLFIKESKIVQQLYNGVENLMAAEKAAGK
eukprot:NODE_10071_length_1378_cov_72.928058.p1 GENE.NODE_10071_length_1378_cov_72.928058~~NODE_10071_length_1378_cov_72.928058.p1  ORF type:complete len:393 (+),score=92.30 NODE_10071_length_1378_cov_72.928058:90-1268(+)